ncbi:hypothetical protein DOT_1977 [Desulfosporosinus sp. OT]|nr:hypothetical protein DOT_1977 [Desulfosporosinus sp. OT]
MILCFVVNVFTTSFFGRQARLFTGGKSTSENFETDRLQGGPLGLQNC